MRRGIQRPKGHIGETIVYGSLVLLLMAGTYWRNAVWNNELELWMDCVKKSPGKDRPHNCLGTIFLSQNKYQEAIPYFNGALRIKPDYAKAHNNLGNVFLNQGKHAEAADQYKEALLINPNFAETHYNLGSVYLTIGDPVLALKEYEALKTMSPRLATALY